MDLLENKGFHGTSLDEIVRKAKAPKGSIYYHFPGGKEQIAAEAILLTGRTLAEAIRGQLCQEMDCRRRRSRVRRAFSSRHIEILNSSKRPVDNHCFRNRNLQSAFEQRLPASLRTHPRSIQGKADRLWLFGAKSFSPCNRHICSD
jgi:AcrR family transcriptional regulator